MTLEPYLVALFASAVGTYFGYRSGRRAEQERSELASKRLATALLIEARFLENVLRNVAADPSPHTGVWYVPCPVLDSVLPEIRHLPERVASSAYQLHGLLSEFRTLNRALAADPQVSPAEVKLLRSRAYFSVVTLGELAEHIRDRWDIALPPFDRQTVEPDEPIPSLPERAFPEMAPEE